MSGVRVLVTSALLGSACAPSMALAQQAGIGPVGDDDGDEDQIVVTGLRSVTRDKLS